MSRIHRTMGDSRKLRFYELDHESKLRLLKIHSHISNSRAMEPGTREEKPFKKTRPYNKAKATHQKPAAYRRCGGGGAEKALEPAAYRLCGGGGQERLYGKPTTEKVLWRAEPPPIRRGTQALTQGRSHARNLPRAIGMAGS